MSKKRMIPWNIELKRENLSIVHILHHYKADRIIFRILAKKYEGNIQIGEPDKCEKLEWFDINELPINIDIKSKNDLKEISQGIFYDNSDFINVN